MDRQIEPSSLQSRERGGLSMMGTPDKHSQQFPDAQGAQAVLRDLCTAPSVYLTTPKSDRPVRATDSPPASTWASTLNLRWPWLCPMAVSPHALERQARHLQVGSQKVRVPGLRSCWPISMLNTGRIGSVAHLPSCSVYAFTPRTQVAGPPALSRLHTGGPNSHLYTLWNPEHIPEA